MSTLPFSRHGYQRHALGAVLRSTFAGHEPATCILAVSDTLADMVEDGRLPDVETVVSVISEMSEQVLVERASRRRAEANLARARAL